ncbi:MAG: SIS domain-containing protein [Acidobacteria bacterium]|nr:SIS domain-containing protein [Acidobacteriota bacterium]
MCGIIAIVRQPATREVPEASRVRDLLRAGSAALHPHCSIAELRSAASALSEANELLCGVPGVCLLQQTEALGLEIQGECASIWSSLEEIELALESVPVDELEERNAAIVDVRDATWSIERDRLRTARLTHALRRSTRPSVIAAALSIQQALSALDRLEVRGRDSAGLHLLVTSHGLDLDDPLVRSAIGTRFDDASFSSDSLRVVDGALSFVYKTAAEIGELGDNTAALRAAIIADELLWAALDVDGSEAVVLGHTRWASVGIISEANAHPVNSEQSTSNSTNYCVAVANGDVDNYADIISSESMNLPADITTDAKVIPTLASAHLDSGCGMVEAFRRTVSVLEGSVAIAAQSPAEPDLLMLALRGSGQGLFVGLAEDAYVIASEPYGVVEETDRYVRMDGETPGNPDNPEASRGQLLTLDRRRAGSLEGITRQAYDGTVLGLDEADVVHAEVTTRDIDRGDHQHFLLKEISEAPRSFAKTLRGKLVDEEGILTVRLGPDSLPDSVRAQLSAGEVEEILVIGQGTAAVAGQACAAALHAELIGSPIRSRAVLATELSGFDPRADLSNVLVVAISQSGTTTDTNRTVDIVRGRGASVIAIVNRRGSDLTDKVDGVLYTSDGRDVEMSVASTKAFYSQIAAGLLLSVAIADAAGCEPSSDRQAMLRAARAMPQLMTEVIAKRDAIGEIAREFAPSRRYWAVVGNGANLVAAREVRIKLSELCYKSIAADVTEDKKHIDLSAEPMILICAAGLEGSTGDDVAKEVGIYRAHKAAPIVIANQDDRRFAAALDVIGVPATHPRLAFVLSAMAGHLFGYEAAKAIDAQAQPLHATRAAIEQFIATRGAHAERGERMLSELRPQIAQASAAFADGLRSGEYNGSLEASTAVRIAALYRFATGSIPLDAYQVEFGKVGTPAAVLDDLVAALTIGIEELTRPIDAIKHQAKTVTVGISRSDENLLKAPLVRALVEAGSPRDHLSYRSLRTLSELDPAVAEVTGFTRYRIEGLDGDSTAEPSVSIIDRGGVSLGIPSRTERSSQLRGTKHRVATDGEVLVGLGRSDGRSLIFVPEVKDSISVGLTLLHVRFHEELSADVLRGVLQGYHQRYAALRDAVMETEPTFRDDLLGTHSPLDLLTLPVPALADRWRA